MELIVGTQHTTTGYQGIGDTEIYLSLDGVRTLLTTISATEDPEEQFSYTWTVPDSVAGICQTIAKDTEDEQEAVLENFSIISVTNQKLCVSTSVW